MPKAWKHHKIKLNIDHVLTQIWGWYSQKCSFCKLLFKKSIGVFQKSHLETPNGHLITKCANESKLHNTYMCINSRTALPTKTHNKKLFLNRIVVLTHLVIWLPGPKWHFWKKRLIFPEIKHFGGVKTYRNLQKLHLMDSFKKLWKKHLDLLFQEKSRNPFKKAI